MYLLADSFLEHVIHYTITTHLHHQHNLWQKPWLPSKLDVTSK